MQLHRSYVDTTRMIRNEKGERERKRGSRGEGERERGGGKRQAAAMRIRNSRNGIDVLAAVCSRPSSSSVPPICCVQKTGEKAPEAGVCSVNQSPWDVTALVLAFFHVDAGLLHSHGRGHCDRQKDSARGAMASKERTAGFGSDPLPPSISSFKSAGKDGTKGRGRQEEKRSDALCFKSEGSAPEPTTVRRSLQNWRRRAAKKGEEEGSAVAKDGRSGGEKGRTCKREDGKGWRCSNEAASGSTLCEHHLSQVRSYCKRPSAESRGGAGKLQPSARAAGGERRRRRRSMSTSSSSMGSFYYYTGFGPAWRETKRKRVSAVAEDDGHTVVEEDDDDDDDEEEEDEADDGDEHEDENGEKGRSRRRKRVKCRSLKSLL
ncbi:unnamed protein product [Victoria cruziana]